MENWENLSLELLTGYDPDGNLVIERFEDIPDYEGLYQVSTFGRVKSFIFSKARILRQIIRAKGYVWVTLCKNSIHKNMDIHILVATVFIPNPENKPEVNHRFRIKTDNRWHELEWMTNRENCTHYRIEQKSSSQYVGVSWYKKGKKWESAISYNGKKVFLGRFDTEIDAHNAYQNALKEINEGTFIASMPQYSSKYKWVYWDKGRNKWRARITHKGKSYSLGSYTLEEDAYEAVQNKLKELNHLI